MSSRPRCQNCGDPTHFYNVADREREELGWCQPCFLQRRRLQEGRWDEEPTEADEPGIEERDEGPIEADEGRPRGDRAVAPGRLSTMVDNVGVPVSEWPNRAVMTESQWWTSTDPLVMLSFLGPSASRRKLRLFACACCRRAEHLLKDSLREVLSTAERYADGLADREQLRAGRAALQNERSMSPLSGYWSSILTATIDATGESLTDHGVRGSADGAATALAEEAAMHRPAHTSSGAPETRADVRSTHHRARLDQCAMLRDIFRPFGPVRLDPSWLRWNDGCVPRMAQVIYEGRRFADLPILGDALEEAGCTAAEILAHCRGEGEHVLGCWLIDALLGKT